MFNLLRKGMVAIAPLALVIGLLLPSAALADATSVLPPSEAGPHLIGEWTGVSCTEESQEGPLCEETPFVAIAEESILSQEIPGFGIVEVANCEVMLEGTIGPKGETTIAGGTVAKNGMKQSICEEIETITPWSDQICEFPGAEGHDQFWDRLEVEFKVPGPGTIEGPLFVQLTETGGAEADPLHVQEAHAPMSEVDEEGAFITADGPSGAGGTPFEFTAGDIWVDSTTEPCPWPHDEEGNIE